VTLDGRLFYTHPIVLHKRRLELMQEGVEGMYEDVELPEWTLHLVRKRRRAGYQRVVTTYLDLDPTCMYELK
jgi:hypothetical protein